MRFKNVVLSFIGFAVAFVLGCVLLPRKPAKVSQKPNEVSLAIGPEVFESRVDWLRTNGVENFSHVWA
jgi:hypothetical protein